MVLNNDLHEFDDVEKNKKLHTFKEYIKRIPFLIDAALFRKTYKDEYILATKEIISLKRQLIAANKRKDIYNKYNKSLVRKIIKFKEGSEINHEEQTL